MLISLLIAFASVPLQDVLSTAYHEASAIVGGFLLGYSGYRDTTAEISARSHTPVHYQTHLQGDYHKPTQANLQQYLSW